VVNKLGNQPVDVFALFGIINYIAETKITQPNQVQNLLSRLLPGNVPAARKRDET